MPGSQSPATLHLEPHTLPSVRTAFDEALNDIGIQLAQLTRAGFIPEAWMGDQVSEGARVHYNAAVMESKDGALSALLAYQTELTRIRNSLKATEDHYRRTEGDNVALWGRQA
jgi:hypothetical protein